MKLLKYRDILKLKIPCAADSTCPQLINLNKEKVEKLKFLILLKFQIHFLARHFYYLINIGKQTGLFFFPIL
jgi:hypothetical protein